MSITTEFQEKPVYDALTRIWQTAASIMALIILSPLLGLIALTIKITSQGPVFYKSKRSGKNGGPFYLYKFRTLRYGSDKWLRHPDTVNEKEVEQYATGMGKVLRKTKLDEVPQLLNVIKGDMNLVGPRPARPEKVAYNRQTIPGYDLRFRIRPGISGEAQVWRGYNTPDRAKLHFERDYIKNRSVLLDLQLILFTFVKILIRWITPGIIFLFLILFLTFIPKDIQSLLFVRILDIRLNLFHIFIVTSVAWLFIRRTTTRTLFLYNVPVIIPALVFFLSGLIPVLFANDYVTPLRGIVYYVITGFIIALIVSHTEISGKHTRRAVSLFALIAVLISSLGIIELFMGNGFILSSFGIDGENNELENNGLYRISSTLANPPVLSTYLILACPIIINKIYHADRSLKRDIWLIAFIVVVIGIFLSQSRTGIFAFLVCSSIFLARKSMLHLKIFIIFFLVLLIQTIYLGGERFQYKHIRSEVQQKITDTKNLIHTIPKRKLIFGVGAKNFHKKYHSDKNHGLNNKLWHAKETSTKEINNMHFLLILENGIVGWVMMMWIIWSTLKKIYQSIAKIKDVRYRDIQWALFSSIIGFLICMYATNVFFYLPVQVLFWGVIGLALGINIHFVAKEKRYLIKWEFGH